jgi:hypothetical protein
MPLRKVRFETDLAGEGAVGQCPFAWRLRYRVRRPRVANLEHLNDPRPKLLELKRLEFPDENDVDQILNAGARPVVAVAPRVGVQLLAEMPLESDDRDLDRLDLRERKNI